MSEITSAESACPSRERGPGTTQPWAPGPEYVVAYTPPYLYKRLIDRHTLPGYWELLTMTAYHAGDPAPDERTLAGPGETPAPALVAWVAGLLGYPVTLERDTTQISRNGTRWRTVPLYWVERNT